MSKQTVAEWIDAIPEKLEIEGYSWEVRRIEWAWGDGSVARVQLARTEPGSPHAPREMNIALRLTERLDCELLRVETELATAPEPFLGPVLH